MNSLKIRNILESRTLAEATALAHVVTKILNGCFAASTAVKQARHLGVSGDLVKEIVLALGMDPSASGLKPSNEEQKRQAAEILDSALSAVTRQATNHDERHAISRLEHLRQIPIRLA